jgi:hypothetical protein
MPGGYTEKSLKTSGRFFQDQDSYEKKVFFLM